MKTYGTLELRGSMWVATVPPHIAQRLKRVFGRIGRTTIGPIELKVTDEVCSELEWFMARYPLKVAPAARKVLEKRAKQYSKDQDDFDRLLTGRIDVRKFDLALPPREYQRLGADLGLRTRGLLIADDAGLGKTVTSICALAEPSTLPALIVTLAHLPQQWVEEIARFAPSLKTHILKKATPYDVRQAAAKRRKNPKQLELGEPEFPHVLIANYHKLAGWADSLAGVVKTVIFDEIQELRNVDSEKYRAAHRIASESTFRFGLSATPFYNYGGELFNVMEILRPGELGTRSEFGIEWGAGQIRDPKAFGLYLRERAMMLRRTRKDVARELPPISRLVQHCESDPEALRAVESAAMELARIILSKDSSWHARGEATREIDWRLRLATGIAKAPYVMALVRLLVESGEQVLLYGWHRQVYDIWLEGMKDLKPVMFTGSESPKQKRDARDAFIAGRSKVLIMSLRAGAGLDGLQRKCRTVVVGELDWSPGVLEQCECRIYRDQQPDPVNVYYPVAADGSDPVLSDVLGLKRGQIEGVRDPEADLIERLDPRAEAGIRQLAERYLARAGTAPAQASLQEASAP